MLFFNFHINKYDKNLNSDRFICNSGKHLSTASHLVQTYPHILDIKEVLPTRVQLPGVDLVDHGAGEGHHLPPGDFLGHYSFCQSSACHYSERVTGEIFILARSSF